MGVIDDQGNFLISKDQRTHEQLSSYTYLDVLVLNLKKIIALAPGGSTRIATLGAALYLMREGKPRTETAAAQLGEQFDLSEAIADGQKYLKEDEGGGVPANNMGGGQIADKKKGLPYVKGKSVLKRKVPVV